MLFETEKKALLFIKFNSDEILVDNVVTPTRAYYCESCMGWHVTHIKDGNKIEQRIEEGKTKREEMDNCLMRGYIDTAILLCTGKTKHVVILIDGSAYRAQRVVAVGQNIRHRKLLQS